MLASTMESENSDLSLFAPLNPGRVCSPVGTRYLYVNCGSVGSQYLY